MLAPAESHVHCVPQVLNLFIFNPIITDFVKTSHLFYVIFIELKRQKHIIFYNIARK